MTGAPSDPSASSRDLDFLIVGTSHSGTTVVQRLACELAGVRVPPETHFLDTFAPGLLRRRRFPLGESEINEEIENFSALGTSRGMEIDRDQFADELGGTCASPVEFFVTLVRHLAGGAATYGEKTPLHLLWWRPLTRALPHLKLVAVVRDPRAVVASHLETHKPWGWSPHTMVAERWSADQREIVKARASLGEARCLVLRYEEVVRDPDRSRMILGSFLRLPSDDQGHGSGQFQMILPWESSKRRALGEISVNRIDAWRSALSGRNLAEIETICEREMAIFGYVPHRSAGPRRIVRLAALRPQSQVTRLHFWSHRLRQVREVRLAAHAGFRSE